MIVTHAVLRKELTGTAGVLCVFFRFYIDLLSLIPTRMAGSSNDSVS